MKMNSRTRWLLYVLLAVSIGIAIVFLSPAEPHYSPPSGGGYYTGPMRSKSDPNVWITADGQRVPPPADAIPLSTSRAKVDPHSAKIPVSD